MFLWWWVSVTALVRLSKIYEGNNTMVNVTGPVRLSKVHEGNNAMVNVTGPVRLKFMETQWSMLLPLSD